MRALALLALVGCGSTVEPAAERDRPSFATSTQWELEDIRRRLRAFCQSPNPHLGATTDPEGCEWIDVGSWRGALVFYVESGRPAAIRMALRGPAVQSEAMRTRILQTLDGLYTESQRGSLDRAMARIVRVASDPERTAGWLGELRVVAGTELDPMDARTREVWLTLQLPTSWAARYDETGEPRTQRRPLAAQLSDEEFPSPMNAIDLAKTRAACDELVDSSPQWDEGDLYVRCMHASESGEAQLDVTWAPGSKRVLYARLVADTEQGPFRELALRWLATFLTPKQLDYARVAIERETRFAGDIGFEGIQVTSTHRESRHELVVRIEPAFGALR